MLQSILNWLGFFGFGVALAAWWFISGPSADSVGPGVLPENQFSGKELVQRIDWGILKYDFTIRNPRAVMKSIPGAGKPFPAIVFEIEARHETPARLFTAKFYDAEGVEIGPVVGADGIPRKRTFGLINLEPDYMVEEPWKWLRGVRSHGWFMLPENTGDTDLPKIHKIAVASLRF